MLNRSRLEGSTASPLSSSPHQAGHQANSFTQTPSSSSASSSSTRITRSSKTQQQQQREHRPQQQQQQQNGSSSARFAHRQPSLRQPSKDPGECAADGTPPNGTSTQGVNGSTSTSATAISSAAADANGSFVAATVDETAAFMQSHRRSIDHDTMGANRSMGAPTPTSTSSYGGMKDEAAFVAAGLGRRDSEFGVGTDDDGYGGAMMEAGQMGDDGHDDMGSPDHGLDDIEHGGNQGDHGMGGFEGSGGDPRMKSEGGEGMDQTPQWNETKTKVIHRSQTSEQPMPAGKERKRLPLACIMCRRKKIRCSGEKPACKHCLRSRIPCVYKQTTRKTAPRTDYMAMLDRRLKRMEERLLKNLPKEEVGAIIATTGRSVVKPAATASGKKRTAGTAFEDETDPWGQLGSAPKQQRILNGMESVGVVPLAKPVGMDVDNDDGAHALPRKEIQEHLAEVFFDCVYGQPYLLLHKPSFMRRLRSGTAPPVLVLAICAVAARFSKHPAVRHETPFLAGETFAAEARRQILKNFDTPNITNLTVCIILGLHEFGTCHGGRSWAFGGMATRMAHALQLHKEAEQDPLGKTHHTSRPDYIHEGGSMGGYMSFTDKEIRRRCMWACFVMDRFNSSGTERPCIINETEIEIQLPVHDRNLQLDSPGITEQLDGGVKDTSNAPEEEKLARASENMGLGAYVIRIVAIYGRVVRYANQGGKEKDSRDIWDQDSHFSELTAEVEHFIDDLPDRFQYTTDNVRTHIADKQMGQFVFLHVAYQQVRLFLQRSVLNSSGDRAPNMPQNFAKTSHELALEAATKIAEIIQDAQDRGILVLAPFTGYCAFNASLVHLVRMFHPQKRIQAEAKRHLEACLRLLLQLKQYWGLFCSITDNLKMLYRKFSDAIAAGESIAQNQDISRMLQYGDWFLKFPQGLAPVEFEDPVKGRAGAEEVASPSDDAALSHRPDLQTADDFFASLGPRAESAHPQKTLPPHHRQPFMHPSPDTHKSPSSLHHGQSPSAQTPRSNHSMRHPSPAIHASPMAVTAPTMMQGAVGMQEQQKADIPLNRAGGSMSQQPSFAGDFARREANAQQHQQQQQQQLTSPMSGRVQSIHSGPAQFPNYTMDSPQSAFQRGQDQQSAYLYDSYPAGSISDSSLIAALSSGLFQGFEHSAAAGVAGVDTFSEQNSSAWFMPFNSGPQDYESGGLGGMGGMGGGRRVPGDNRGGGAGGGGGGRGHAATHSHLMAAGAGQAVPGDLPSPATYHGGAQR